MEYIKLSEVCHTIGRGKAIRKSIDGDVYALGFTDFANEDRENEKLVPKCKLQNEYEDLKMYNIEIMDIVLPPITRENLNIKQVQELNENKKIIYSSRAVYIRVNKEKYFPRFLYNLLSTENYKKRLLEEVYTKATYANIFQISISKLKEFQIPKISINEQEEICKKGLEIIKELHDLTKMKIEEFEALYKNF